MDKIRFKDSCCRIIDIERKSSGIGTLAEKTLHAVLKRYFENDENNHEIKVSSFVADILCDKGIIEIQTNNFNKLRRKLEEFLKTNPVTIVYPVASTKWLIWIDENTGEMTGKRKSPKTGSRYEIFPELYKIKQYLTNPNLRLCIILLDIEEYRMLNGWSKDRKKGSTRYERIPVDITGEIEIENIGQYAKFIPEGLPEIFTAEDYKKMSKISLRSSQTALNILNHIGTVERVGKSRNKYLYRIKVD
ncbi:MAG: hypothetical protein ACYCYI_07165 [Saccharofermentanales bacterium]